MRELRPALTADEIRQGDQVHRHAVERGLKLLPNKPVKVKLRCNQLAIDFSACDWTVTIETRAARATDDARAALRVHLAGSHPHLTARPGGVESIVNSTWYNLRDIGG